MSIGENRVVDAWNWSDKQHPTLFEAMAKLRTPVKARAEAVKLPMRMIVTETVRLGGIGACVLGKIVSGKVNADATNSKSVCCSESDSANSMA